MKNIITGLWLSGAAALLLPLCGCMQVDYIGQRYEPLTADNVKLYNDQSDVPPKQYYTMGKATLTAPDGYSSDEIRTKLKKEAAEVGADAVEIVTAEREKMAEYSASDTANDGAMSTQSKVSSTSWEPGGARNYTNSFGEAETGDNQSVTRYQIVVKAYFLRTAAKVKTNSTETAPAPAPAAAPKSGSAGTIGLQSGSSLQPDKTTK